MRDPRLTIMITALAAMAGAAAELAAADTKDGLEWSVSLGSTVTFAMPSFEDRWSVLVADPFPSFIFSESARYTPVNPLGVNVGAQMWLPFGLGFFAEYQRHVQDVPSRIVSEAALGEGVAFLEGRLDTEKFERNETRFHVGVGYRIRAGSDGYFEVSGGASRVSFKQDLAREIGIHIDIFRQDCPAGAVRCTIEIEIEQREPQKGSTWGVNAGAGFVRFFNKNVGIGAQVRYSKGGAVELRGLEAFDEEGNQYRNRFKVKTEAVTAGVSLKVRF